MERLNTKINTPLYIPSALKYYFEGLKISFLDIETTGLNPSRSKLILGGLLVPNENGLDLSQYLAEDIKEEKRILDVYSDSLKDTDVIITYNGHRFDMPFLRHRLMYHNMPIPYEPSQSFDLYRVCHIYSPLRQFLPDLKQKTVEKFLGIDSNRDDSISGAESVELYRNYTKTGDSTLKNKILLHNSDDVMQLSRLLRITEKLDPHKIFHHEGFTVPNKDMRCYINSIVIKDGALQVKGFTRNIPYDFYAYEMDFHIAMVSEERTFTLTIPYRDKSGLSFIDLSHLFSDLSAFKALSGFRSGYLVLLDKTPGYHEMNILIREMLKKILYSF